MTNETQVTRNNKSFLLSLALIWYFSGPAIRFVMKNSIGVFFSLNIINFLYGSIFVMLILLCVLLIKDCRKMFLYFLIFNLFIGLFFMMTLLFHPDYEYYYFRDILGIWYELYSPITGAIYALLVVLMADSAERLWDSISMSAWINIFYYLILVISAKNRGYWEAYTASGAIVNAEYDLGLGYSLAFVTLVFASRYMQKKNLIHLAASIFALLLTVQNGSRGALLCIFLFVFLNFIIKREDSFKNKPKFYLSIMFIIMISVYVYFNYNLILKNIGELFTQMGLSSRTINAMINGTLTEDNGRSIIVRRAYTAIKEGGFWGLGAYGDRPYIAPYYWWGYCHNIFLEILCNFGLFFGSILILILVYSIVNILLKKKNIYYTYTFIVFLCSCAKMLLSDTIWGYPDFWAFLGIMFMYPKYGKLVKKIDKQKN